MQTINNNKSIMQSKKHSMIEVITNTIVGLLFSFVIQVIIYPILEIDVSIKQNVLITFMFFVASILRGYLLRRFFTKLFKQKVK